jgi:2-polyprenyl-3-methyl-5-hydroxy-6-metoxy-1,4-benzoquinol methylase
MGKKLKYTGQDVKAETDTFEAESMEHGLEPLQEEDYQYFFKVTGLSEKADKKIRVLEVGCGSGPFGRRLAKNGYEVTGIDLSLRLVKAANDAAKKDGVKYRAIAGDVFKYSGKGFDIVLCAGFLHHFTDLGPIIEKMRSFLRTGGHVVFIEPNGSNPAVKATEWVRKSVWPFNTMSALGTMNETSHTAEKYTIKFLEAGYKKDEAAGFIKKPKFDDYGLLMNILLRMKYLIHVVSAGFMKREIRGTVLVMTFKK